MTANMTYNIGSCVIQFFQKSFSVNGINICPSADADWQMKLEHALWDISTAAKMEALKEVRIALGMK